MRRILTRSAADHLWLRLPSSLLAELKRIFPLPSVLPRGRQGAIDHAANHQKLIFALQNAG